MTPGWLDRAVLAAFGDPDEDECQVCGGLGYVELVAFAGELMDQPIPCPAPGCRVAPPPLPIYRWDWRTDTPRGAA